MTVLQVSDVRFGFGGDTLFEGVTFTLAIGERAALVAPNGAGKSTLLRIVAGEVEPDAGSAVIKKETTVGYYRQSHEIDSRGDVLSALLSGYSDVLALREKLAVAQREVAAGDEDALERLARVTDEYHVAGGDAIEHEVAAIAHKLGFTDSDLARPAPSLSGGERGRLRLGVVLAQKPELLLLDEPTNHLDLDTIGWLESYLAGYRGAVLVVSHDRAFLDDTCSQTFELGRKGLRSYPLRYSEYAVAREEDLARERAVLERQQDFIDKTQAFIQKNIAGQKTKQAQSRRKMLEKLDRLERPEDVWKAAEKMSVRFAPAARTGDIVLDAKGLGATRGGRVLFDGVELLIRRGERIGVVGPNGAGKTTLLNIIAGKSRTDRGTVKRGTNLQEGYFDQHLGEVNPANTAVEEVRSVRGDFTAEKAREYLARFRFWGDAPLRSVSGYSGGERSRLALAKLLLEPRNLLFLDEPTNHLDIPAAEILEEALVSFEGTVLFVSHDRRFLENVATRIVSVRDGRVTVYNGGFRDFVQDTHKKIEELPQKREKPKSEPPPPGKSSYEQQKAKARDEEKKKRRIAELESSIAVAEAEIEIMREKLKQDHGGDWARLAELAEREQELSRKVEGMMTEWAKLSEGT
ncbi:MAG TPA: ABC-F family ATP-binding cassette domain-containing protein [Polyangiaceae bacterium]